MKKFFVLLTTFIVALGLTVTVAVQAQRQDPCPSGRVVLVFEEWASEAQLYSEADRAVDHFVRVADPGEVFTTSGKCSANRDSQAIVDVNNVHLWVDARYPQPVAVDAGVAAFGGEVTPQPTEQVVELPVWAMSLSDDDAACAVADFAKYGIEPVNSVIIPTDDSPSPTLALIGVMHQAASQIEINPEGRQLTFRGGETGEIQSAEGQVLIVYLMDAVRAHASWYSDPTHGLVVVGGEPLSEVGLTALNGAGQIDIQVQYNGAQVTEVRGNMASVNNVNTVFVRLNQFDLTKFVPGSWNAGNLKGVTVPVNTTGCVDMLVSANVPSSNLWIVGIGTAQSHLTEQALVILPGQGNGG